MATKPCRTVNHRQQITTTGDLKWQGAPSETYSDWNIEIVTTNTCDNDDTEEPGVKKDADKQVQEDGSKPNQEEPTDKGRRSDGMEMLVQTYHVHCFASAFGTRRSEYCSKLFRSGNTFQEGASSTSRVELHPLAATAFPMLLDYVYESDRPLIIDAQSATALHRLEEYFEMESLRSDALKPEVLQKPRHGGECVHFLQPRKKCFSR